MRVTAASSSGRSTNLRSEPESGTKSRVLYDAFISSPGVPIQVAPIRDSFGVSHSVFSHMIMALTDYYELDIRCLRYGTWVLAGRWNGSKYTDYIAPIVKGRR